MLTLFFGLCSGYIVYDYIVFNALLEEMNCKLPRCPVAVFNASSSCEDFDDVLDCTDYSYTNTSYIANSEFVGFHFSNMGLAGTIPLLVGYFTALTNLDLSNNEFVSTVPTEIALLTNLVVLRLNGNHITGMIPTINAPLSDCSLDNSCFDVNNSGNCLTSPIIPKCAVACKNCSCTVDASVCDAASSLTTSLSTSPIVETTASTVTFATTLTTMSSASQSNMNTGLFASIAINVCLCVAVGILLFVLVICKRRLDVARLNVDNAQRAPDHTLPVDNSINHNDNNMQSARYEVPVYRDDIDSRHDEPHIRGDNHQSSGIDAETKMSPYDIFQPPESGYEMPPAPDSLRESVGVEVTRW